MESSWARDPRGARIVISAVGLASDPTIRHFLSVAGDLGASVELIDIGRQVEQHWALAMCSELESWVDGSDRTRRTAIEGSGSYYCRLIDLSAEFPSDAARWQLVTEAWSSWLETCEGMV